jgi:hypothetical protein
MSLLLAAVVLWLCACVPSTGQAPSPLAAPAVAVERDTYRVQRVRGGDGIAVTIVATFTNRTADTIVLQRCHDRPAVILEKWVGGEWVPAFSQICPDILDLNAPRLAPGQSRTDTALAFASVRPNIHPSFELDTVPGLYRVVYWKAHGDWRDWQPNRSRGALLPKELRVSNAFRVVE